MKIILSEKQVKNIIKNHISENSLDELNYQSLQDDENLQDLRDAIDRNRMVSVAFVKKDGSVKHMLVRRNLSSYVASEREKTDAQRNVEANHDLKRVVDVNAYKRELKAVRMANPGMDDEEAKELAAKKAWKSINLRNVLGFMVGGRFIDLRDENEIMDRYGEQVYGQLTKSMINSMRPVENNPENMEGEIGEQGFLRSLKNIISPEIKLVKNAGGLAHDFRFASQQTKNIMAKFGTVINTAKIRQLMVPVNDTLPIIAHELNQLKGKVNPNFKLGANIKIDYDNLQKALRVPEGQTLSIVWAYREAENLKDYLTRMKSEKMVTPAGLSVLKRAETQVDTILKEMETAVSKIAFAK